jgi:hypothetical protein
VLCPLGARNNGASELPGELWAWCGRDRFSLRIAELVEEGLKLSRLSRLISVRRLAHVGLLTSAPQTPHTRSRV